MTNELRIARLGKSVFSDDPNDFIFHSRYNTFKIVLEGSLTSQTVDADPKTFSVAHGQSITPSVYAFAKFPDGYTAMANEIERADTGNPPDRYWLVEVDATNIYFIFYKGSTSNYSVGIKYYVFETPL